MYSNGSVAGRTDLLETHLHLCVKGAIQFTLLDDLTLRYIDKMVDKKPPMIIIKIIKSLRNHVNEK